MAQRTENLDELARAAGERLIARAASSRGLKSEQIAPRLRAALEKYLLRARPESDTRAIRDFYEQLHADDLLCVIACERGDEAAWQDLIKTQTATILAAARSATNNDAEAEDLAQSVWAELYGLRVGDDGRPAGKLSYYSGCGSLGGWLRAIVAQLAVDRHRRAARLVQTDTDAEFDALAQNSESSSGAGVFNVGVPSNPENSFAERETASVVHEALARAISELDAEDRLLIKLYYFDDVRLREAGALLGVHEATASRRLARAQNEIRKRVEKFLRLERKWTESEIARALNTVSERCADFNLQKLLTAETFDKPPPVKS
jgi:RNA polymerase sigma-70 factor (ECF subfamily)